MASREVCPANGDTPAILRSTIHGMWPRLRIQSATNVASSALVSRVANSAIRRPVTLADITMPSASQVVRDLPPLTGPAGVRSREHHRDAAQVLLPATLRSPTGVGRVEELAERLDLPLV